MSCVDYDKLQKVAYGVELSEEIYTLTLTNIHFVTLDKRKAEDWVSRYNNLLDYFRDSCIDDSDTYDMYYGVPIREGYEDRWDKLSGFGSACVVEIPLR